MPRRQLHKDQDARCQRGSRANHEASGPRPRVRDQWPETKLLGWNAKLGELGLVDTDEVVVCLGHLGHIVLERLDHLVLVVEHLLQLGIHLHVGQELSCARAEPDRLRC